MTTHMQDAQTEISCPSDAVPTQHGHLEQYDSLRAKRIFEGPGRPKTPTKIPREDPQREKKKNENVGGRGKKRAKFWAVRRRAVIWTTHTPHTPHTNTHTNTPTTGLSRSDLTRWPAFSVRVERLCEERVPQGHEGGPRTQGRSKSLPRLALFWEGTARRGTFCCAVC